MHEAGTGAATRLAAAFGPLSEGQLRSARRGVERYTDDGSLGTGCNPFRLPATQSSPGCARCNPAVAASLG